MSCTRKRKTAPKIVSATILFLAVSLNSPPSILSTTDAGPPPPTPEEVYVLEQVAEWVLGGPISEDFEAFADADSTSVTHAQRQSFELFRRFGSDHARQEKLLTLPFGDLIQSSAERHQVDGLLLAAMVEAESGFDPEAVSPQGAMGLMQVMPDTAAQFTVLEPLNPATNIEIGARYMSQLLSEFDGDVALALAGYNAGPGNVARYGGVPPFRETRAYVDRVLTRYVNYHQDLWERSGARSLIF
jgi:soluble lytic murein transglycosylase-like protein